jgi:hypothetical protein
VRIQYSSYRVGGQDGKQKKTANNLVDRHQVKPVPQSDSQF